MKASASEKSGRAHGHRAAAFTRAELLAVLVALTLLIAVAGPSLAHNKPRAQRSTCLNNLRQLGQGLRVWRMDHGDKFPWRIPITQGGSFGSSLAYQFFNVISNELSTAQPLFCPSDRGRSPTNLMVNLRRNENVSYFVGLHADEDVPDTFIAGDRDIVRVAAPATCGLAGNIVATSFPAASFDSIRWSATNHVDSGNLVFSDGSVRLLSSVSLRPVLLNPNVLSGAAESHILNPLTPGESP